MSCKNKQKINLLLKFYWQKTDSQKFYENTQNRNKQISKMLERLKICKLAA
jgi:hypothetical protein